MNSDHLKLLYSGLTKFVEATHVVIPFTEANQEPSCCSCKEIEKKNHEKETETDRISEDGRKEGEQCSSHLVYIFKSVNFSYEAHYNTR